MEEKNLREELIILIKKSKNIELIGRLLWIPDFYSNCIDKEEYRYKIITEIRKRIGISIETINYNFKDNDILTQFINIKKTNNRICSSLFDLYNNLEEILTNRYNLPSPETLTKEPVFHSRLSDELDESHIRCWDTIYCDNCNKMLHSFTNECMDCWFEFKEIKYNFCKKCFFEYYDEY